MNRDYKQLLLNFTNCIELSEDFLEKYKHKFQINRECYYDLPSSFLEKDKDFLARNQELFVGFNGDNHPQIPEKLVLKWIDKINWNYICLKGNMSTSFWEENIDKIIWEHLVHNSSVSFEFLVKNKDKINSLYRARNMPFEYFKTMIKENKYVISWMDKQIFTENDWEWLIEQYPEYINWYFLCTWNFSEEFWKTQFKKNSDKIIYFAMLSNSNLSLDFWLKVFDKYPTIYPKFKADMMCTLPLSWWQENIDDVNWNTIVSHPEMTVEFAEKYKDRINFDNDTVLPLSWLEKNIDIKNSSFIWNHRDLDEEFFENYKNLRYLWFALKNKNFLSNVGKKVFEKILSY